MNNPLFGGAPQNPPMNNVQNIMQRYNQFRQMFQGDPRQQIQQLLNSGRVSPQQYNQAMQMAQQLQHMMGGK